MFYIYVKEKVPFHVVMMKRKRYILAKKKKTLPKRKKKTKTKTKLSKLSKF